MPKFNVHFYQIVRVHIRDVEAPDAKAAMMKSGARKPPAIWLIPLIRMVASCSLTR